MLDKNSRVLSAVIIYPLHGEIVIQTFGVLSFERNNESPDVSRVIACLRQGFPSEAILLHMHLVLQQVQYRCNNGFT